MMNNRTKINLFTICSIIIIFISIQLMIQNGIIDKTYQVILTKICINIILAMGLNLVVGIAGQFSLGHAGFMAIGAYSAAVMLLKQPNFAGLIIGSITGILISVIVSLIVAIPTLRLRGDYLAIATLGISEIIRIVILNLENVTNGAAGLSNIPKIATWPVLFIYMVVCAALILNFAISSPGRATIAIREDEIAAQASGVNTTKYKVIAFVIGAITASLAGALYASSFSVIKPGTFGFMKSVDVLIIVVFGGIGSMTGSVIAAIFLGIVDYMLSSYGDLRMIMYAVALIVVMVFRPGGLLGNREFPFNKLLKLKKEEEVKKI